jgi:inner membrane transporter RhtA
VRQRPSLSGAWLVLGSAISLQVGAAFSKSLFDQTSPASVVLMRLVFGGTAVWLIFRPRLRGRGAREWLPVIGLGVVLACMNNAFYAAIDRVPLGIGVTVEFIGPLTVAVIATRRRLDLIWVLLAAAGIALLADPGGQISALGIGLAALAGVFWGIYIVLGIRVGRVWPGASGLAVAMAIGAALSLPSGLVTGGRHLLDPGVLAAGLGVGLACSALPWSLEIEALRRLPAHVFGVLMSLEPAVAAISGLLVLGERLSARVAASIALVVVASAGAALGARDPELPVDA